ncbi:hypothetical protein G4228_019762 [Cervus hanglu yarkandensis]|uniref:MHC class I-like antigen recognition-like domain-containing protein n=1 Tax=Cervus hanglu yarkandensis TaxID=84702 RepID=A0A833SG49_9CERV|nr:hypothetical protein G4228_019762 [Cervus hanglu yarkandensis]
MSLAHTAGRLLLILQLIEPRKTLGNAHSLSYNFTIDPQPRPGQPWCEVQGHVDREVFLSYDCGHAKIIFTSPLGEEVKTIKAWETQIETLGDIRDHLLDFTLEKHTVMDAHSLCLDLTVKSQSRPGQPWCQIQGAVDTKPFLQYDSDSNKVRPLGFLGEEVNNTKAWTELSQMLGEAGRELRMVLPVIKLDKKEMRDSLCVGGVCPPSLQVRLCCQREAEQCSGASLLFSLKGQTALLLDTMSITWTFLDPGATGIKEEWENNQELSEYFRKISTGDCSYWLSEFLEHWENMLLPEPTGN